jgi:hypothetical protein
MSMMKEDNPAPQIPLPEPSPARAESGESNNQVTAL